MSTTEQPTCPAVEAKEFDPEVEAILLERMKTFEQDKKNGQPWDMDRFLLPKPRP